MTNDRIIFGAPFIEDDEIQEVVDTLRSGWIGTGRKCEQFEREFKAYVGSPFALAMSSCTAGLHLSLQLTGVGSGDEVVTSPLTFAATANVIVHTGARPVFCDIDPHTLNLDPAAFEGAIGERTRAVIPVHFGGLPCEMDRIEHIARVRGIGIIEDAAHAIGARYAGRRIGGRGNLTSFSFYANKNLTTAEGGMLTTDNEEWAERIQVLRDHGLSRNAWKRFQTSDLILPTVLEPGFKYNMTDIQASLGLHQLRKLERVLEIRERYAARYDRAFAEMEELYLQTRPTDRERNRHALHLYVLVLDLKRLRMTRNEVVSELRARGIGAAIHYQALHLQPYYREAFKFKAGQLPVAERVSESILTLPLTARMSEEDVDRVIAVVKDILVRSRRRVTV